jgi:predicted dehydrogenase
MLRKIIGQILITAAFLIKAHAAPSWDCPESSWNVHTNSSPNLYHIEIHQTDPFNGLFGLGYVTIAYWDGSAWQFGGQDDFTDLYSDGTAWSVFDVHIGHDYRFTVSDGDSNFLALLYIHESNATIAPRAFENSSGTTLCTLSP